MGGSKYLLLVLLVLGTIGWSSAFLDSPEGKRFLTAYADALEVTSVNIFLPAKSKWELKEIIHSILICIFYLTLIFICCLSSLVKLSTSFELIFIIQIG